MTSLKKWLSPEELHEWREWHSRGKKEKVAREKELRRRTRKRKRKHTQPKPYKQLRAEMEVKCRAYLETFWPEFNSAIGVEEKIRLLRAAANPPWRTVPKQFRDSLRAEYNRSKDKLLNLPPCECAACEDEWVSERHHIIPLAFGGINDTMNLIRIGEKCHESIHPWMAR